MSPIFNECPPITRTNPRSSNIESAIGVPPLEALNNGITDAEKEIQRLREQVRVAEWVAESELNQTTLREKGVIMAWVGYGNPLRWERVSKVYIKIYICTTPSSPSSPPLSSPSPSSSPSDLHDLSDTAELLLSILKKGYGGSYYEREDRVARNLAWDVEALKGVRDRFRGFGYVRFESRRELVEAVRRAEKDGGRCYGWD
ncbi:hypothetical protein L198_07168 [Cryptococcus wingfieldii CBS 7118]|uniref:Uncharacterized protein n=1 Tax=Cryptococcus wingfieldii CBS 7118 TaxID=1295528 RepID=A0A1E3IFW0_9TREE|nr:hypothetical protein L198_07168 [Cryptococcus wingfieldii CBS 7118]ODN86806.1 hypothetical protein L198_07168 [Cryptococcus wingfieldii CBS 7118]